MSTRAPDRHPRISVIVPVYNGARFIAGALDSIRDEGHCHYQVIVVDDGSDDGSADLASQWGASNGRDVRVIRQAHAGPAVARNRGIAAASASLLAFLDVDDLWPAGRTRLLLDRLGDDDATGLAIGLVQWQALDPGEHQSAEERFLLQHFAAPDLGPYVVAALFRRWVFDRIGLFDPELRHGEDLDLFNRLKEQRIPIRPLAATSYLYRRHSGNMTRGRDAAAKQFPQVIKKSLDRRRAAASGNASTLPTLADYLSENRGRPGVANCE